jgi:ribonuclease D
MEDNGKISKAELANLPMEVFKGRIIVIDDPQNLDAAMQALWQQSHVGFDTETRPSFHKGRRYGVALMQLSTQDTCYLFRINKIGMPESLLKFLADASIMKIGLSLRDDFGAIRRRTEAPLEGFLDLQNYVVQFGISDASLQKIYAILFGKKISKRQRLTNWEADTLTAWQQKYAALDAWACLVIYNHLYNGNRNL